MALGWKCFKAPFKRWGLVKVYIEVCKGYEGGGLETIASVKNHVQPFLHAVFLGSHLGVQRPKGYFRWSYPVISSCLALSLSLSPPLPRSLLCSGPVERNARSLNGANKGAS